MRPKACAVSWKGRPLWRSGDGNATQPQAGVRDARDSFRGDSVLRNWHTPSQCTDGI